MKTAKILSVLASLALLVSCGSARRAMEAPGRVDNNGIEMTVHPERNGGAPETLELTITNNTGQPVQFGAGYSIERSVGGQWVEHELGNFAVIAIMYGLEPGGTGKYTISLFSDRVKYPEGDYRVVKQIYVGETGSRTCYAGFRIIEPR